MLAVKWREVLGVEIARGSIVRIVEPESHMKRVCGLQCRVRVKSEDLVEQDGFDSYMTIVFMFSDFYVGLIPGQSKTSFELRLEVRIGRAVREERATLHSKQVKRQAGLDAVQIQYQGIVELPADDGGRAVGSSKFDRRKQSTTAGLGTRLKVTLSTLLCATAGAGRN